MGLQFLPIPTHCGRAPDLQSLPIPTQRWKDLSMDYATGFPYLQIGNELSMDFETGLPMPTNLKDTSYDSIFVVVDRLTKMIHSKPAQMIDALGLAEIISDVVI